ncbi:hypothetical protein ACOBQX_02485 [Actinokineospora sp. G85]|uniref:hypothetical protein n=1 Tax=Actinokineospora sp. G85 TaxID=3406626 RepID=UPI003C762361
MTSTVAAKTAPAELSCYTANLVDYLAVEGADATGRLAGAIRLAVRTGPRDGAMAADLLFSQHERIDRDDPTRGLGYRGARDWAETESALLAELRSHGRVLAVANTARLPWAPTPPGGAAPHWILLRDRTRHGWQVVDRFAALLPHGEQHAHEGALTDDQLRLAMTPVSSPPAAVRNRDALALGERTEVPDGAAYRWLRWEPATASVPDDGWVDHPVEALTLVADVLAGSERALAAHLDDVWAATRHHRFRLTVLADRGLVPAEPLGPVLDAFAELPRALRFALDSARRGRPRPSLVRKTFAHLIAATEALLADVPHALGKEQNR